MCFILQEFDSIYFFGKPKKRSLIKIFWGQNIKKEKEYFPQVLLIKIKKKKDGRELKGRLDQ